MSYSSFMHTQAVNQLQGFLALEKVSFHKLVKGDPIIKSCASAFICPNKTNDDISELGKELMVDIFGGKSTDTLTSLRHIIFTKKVVCVKAFVTPERLPLTSSATNFHSRCVYYQIMVWMGVENDMKATDWGWKEESHQLIPVMTEENAAPDDLLKVVHCNCSTGCKTARCSCRRYALPCTAACGPCQTENCDNPNNQDVEDDEDSDD